MSIRKFRLKNLREYVPGNSVVLDRDEETHLFKILRARPGETVELLDGCGRIGTAEVRAGRTLLLKTVKTEPIPGRRIHLYIAPPRRQKMDDILRGSAELGVFRIVPLLCEYGVSSPDDSSVSGRWTDLLFEACKQSGNPYLPECSAPMPFASGIADALERCGKIFYGSPRESKADAGVFSDGAWFVGPEGGFSEKEENLLTESGALPLKIGDWILRVETAALAGIAVLQR